MARQGINTGSSPDAGDGDALLIGAIKINDNFDEIYTLLGDGTTLAPGIVTSIVAGTNVTVSGSTGQVTINASGSSGSSSQWVSTAAGIHTLSSVGIGTTNPTSALTVVGSGASLSQLYVTGVSTFNNNVRVSGIVTTNSILVSNDGGNNGSVLIEDTGAYSQITFRSSSGLNRTQIQGVEANLYITPGSGGYVSLSGPTNNVFYGSGDVLLNNSSQGTTHAANGLRVTGLTSTTSFNVGTGGTIINATATGLVGIGTTNPTSALTVKGNTSLETLNVSGVSTFSDYVSVASTADFRINIGSGVEFKNSSGGALVKITSDGGSTAPRININSAYLQGNSSGDLDLWVPSGAEAITSVNSIEKFKVSGAGVTVTGTTFTNELNVSGVSTFSSGAIVPKGQSIDFGDLQIFTNTPGINNSATTFLYTGSNDFQVISDNFKIKTTSGFYGSLTKADFSGAPILYYVTASSSSERLQITDYGVKITGLTSTTELSVSGVSTVGIVTGATYYGDASYVVDGKWTLGANGTSDYTFTGIGFTQTTNDPVLYLARGRVYEFVNNSGGAHPFEIRLSDGGAAYNNGVLNNASAIGTIRFEVPFNAPNTLYYQCTSHSGMGNTISVYPNTI